MSQVPNSYSSAPAPSPRKLSYMRVAPRKVILSAPVILVTILIVLVASLATLEVISSLALKMRHQPFVRGQIVPVSGSPLQALIMESSINELLGEEDRALVQRIKDQSSLEFKTLLISETVVPVDSAEKLHDFVKTQLHATEDIITPKQAASILEMVRLSPRESVVEIEAIGDRGSLSSSVALALIKQHKDNIHYMLVAVKAEPHLGIWKRLSQAKRNSWNAAISKMLKEKVVLETRQYLKQGNGRGVETIPKAQKFAAEVQKPVTEVQKPIAEVAEAYKPIPLNEG